MRRVILVLAAILTVAGGLGRARAGGDRAGQFDYYVLSLSWSPDWCALVGDARRDPQCRPGLGLSFTLHGLWPQYERGYPSDCHTARRDPSRAQTAAMADVMGGAGLAWHEWKTHGRCSGLSAADYFAKARAAYHSITIPEVLKNLRRDVKLPASVVEQAFIEANPGLTPAMITITCDRGMIQEARVCLTKDLQPRPCGADAARDCRMTDARMDGVR